MTTPRLSEDELIESLIWSETDYSLAEFVEKFQLPQLVNVEVGYFTGNETTSLSSGQVLNLHSLVKIKKLVCQTRSNNAVVIPFNCPSKVLVQHQTNDCKHTKISTHQLTSLFGQIKYIYVLDGYYNANCPAESFEIGEILEINDMDSSKGLVRCNNVETKQNVSIPVDSTALFAPLLDCKEYALAEIEQTFGFPTKVRFRDYAGTKDQRQSRRSSSMLVSGLEEITVFQEIEQTVVMLTTFGGNPKDKVYLQIAKDLPIQICAALAFVSGDETYQNIVKNLDSYFSNVRLQDVENLDVYESSNSVRNGIQEIASNPRVFEQASDEVQRKLLDFRAKEFEDEPTPPLPPKKSSSLDRRSRPGITRKPGREHDVGPAVKGKTVPKLSTKPTVSKKPKTFSLPRMKTSVTNGDDVDDSGYVKSFPKPRGGSVKEHRKSESDNVYDYAFVPSENTFCHDNIYEEAQFTSSDDETQETSSLTSGYVYEEASWTGEEANESCLPEPLVNPSKPSYNDVYEDVVCEACPEAHESIFGKPLPLVHPKPNKPHLQAKTSEVAEDSGLKCPVVYAKPIKLPQKPSNYKNIKIEACNEKVAVDSMASELPPSPTSYENTELDNSFARPKVRPKPKLVHSPIDAPTVRGSSDPVGYDQKVIARSSDPVGYDQKGIARSSDPVGYDQKVIARSSGPVGYDQKAIARSSDPVVYDQKVVAQFPKDLSGLSVSNVGEILTELRMCDYVSVFDEELVDGEMLCSMDEESLVSLGMNAFQVKKLLKFIGGWRPNV